MVAWLILALALALPAAAQVRTPGNSAVSEHAGPIGGDSRPVGEGSRAMRDGSRPIGESSSAPSISGRLGGSVRDASTRSMHSGPVSSLSRGSMTQPRTLPDGGSMTEHSAGAVKHDIDRPLGSRISEPLRELAPLQAQLRAVREQGAAAAVAAAAAPVAAEPDLLPIEADAGIAPTDSDDVQAGHGEVYEAGSADPQVPVAAADADVATGASVPADTR